MSFINKIQEKYIDYFQYNLYLMIFTCFLADIKIYIPLFALNIFIILTLILKKQIKINLSKWQVALFIFISWSLINSVIALSIFKYTVSFKYLIKLTLNMSLLLFVSIIIKNGKVKFEKSKFINLMEFIIIINFIQIILIYIIGDLVGVFINGTLTQNSSTAHATSAFYTLIGAFQDKNIWAGKFTLFFVTYLYMCCEESIEISGKRKVIHILIGVITLLLLLSRTNQIAIVIPTVFMSFYLIRNISYKYKIAIGSVLGVLVLGGITIYLNKFFHINFNLNDGGFSRLIIWDNLFKNFRETNWIIGNGIGYSGEFIRSVVGRTESNLHNVYLNIFFELGVIGISSYVMFLVLFIKSFSNKNNIVKILSLLVVPFMIITSLQYLGFDNDIVMPIIIILVINNFRTNKLALNN